MAEIGPLLRGALRQQERMRSKDPEMNLSAAVTQLFGDTDGRLPIMARLPDLSPFPGEDWEEFRHRAKATLTPVQAYLHDVFGSATLPLYLGNAVAGLLRPEQIAVLADRPGLTVIELDPPVQAAAMDDVVLDVELARFQWKHPGVTGKGIRVAVLDSGVDTQHPHLRVAQSISTCGEDVALPGVHGTHCAGAIASRDSAFPGLAPDVELINVKVLTQHNVGFSSHIVNGMQAAIDRHAHILSMSVGFNHLPTWSHDGHGWPCANGLCTLCMAVENAAALNNPPLIVAAAGNMRAKANHLRQHKHGNSFDTELLCPGQARSAFTVGAVTKSTFLPAYFSSEGPTAYGTAKPDIYAPGVNIMSTVPVPRQTNGAPVPHPQRTDLFGRNSGTSMATPLVAATAALIMESFVKQGLPITPGAIRKAILANAAALSSGLPPIGSGTPRLKLPS